jgi:hypothetical protein
VRRIAAIGVVIAAGAAFAVSQQGAAPVRQSVSSDPTTAPVQAAPAPIQISITLDRTSVVAGEDIHGTAAVTNSTGGPLATDACLQNGPWLNVGIANAQIKYDPAFTLVGCAPFVLPSGVTLMPITVLTTYLGCSQSAGQSSAQSPACLDGNREPPLPAGQSTTSVVTLGPQGAKYVATPVDVTLLSAGS